MVCTVNSGSNGRHLWEFVRDLLLAGDNGDKLAAEIIRWENRNEGIFRIVDSKQVAQLWGIRKRNKTMTYEKLSRALRLASNCDFTPEIHCTWLKNAYLNPKCFVRLTP